MKNIYNPSYYQILEVSAIATSPEIKSAYRKLMKLYHEDKNPGNLTAKIKSQEINEANEVLSDVDKRANYDHGLLAYIKAGEERAKSHRDAQTQRKTGSYAPSFNFGVVVAILIIIIGLFALATSDNDSKIS